MPSVVLAVGALRPDPDQARSWVERELSRPEYRRTLLERLAAWLGDLWDGLTRTALDASPLSAGVAVAVLVVLVAVALAAAGRVRRDARAPRHPDASTVGQVDSPERHREAALRALDAGAHEQALVEAFRALVARSARRGLLHARPGLTAHEVATELGGPFAGRADDLLAAAGAFDRVFYGDQPADPDDARTVLRLDDELGRTRPLQPATRSGA